MRPSRSLKDTSALDSIGNIILFGSPAKGKAGSESDIDLLVFATDSLQKADRNAG
ncbi:MAG TPA: nucleotidyltransferase domain-containing protein [Candidatus Latescibacteria bacterium]|nr:nucleotidyltransferase domain-containing protein [Candidatus Latescibacterota bacterium]